MKKYEVNGRQMIYHMPTELDHHEAESLRKEMDLAIDSYQIKELVLDFGDTQFMDSSGVGVVIGRCKKMDFYQGKIKARNLSSRMVRLFEAAGLHKLVEREVV